MAQTQSKNLISGVPKDVNMRISYNGKFLGKYDMMLMMKADGISCALCGLEIREDVFYCEQDNIFMHKKCLIENHRINTNPSFIDVQNRTNSTFHEDRAVDVRFRGVKKGGAK